MAQLKNLIVNGVARIVGKLVASEIVGNLTGTINGFSVSKSVPSDAVFTDHTYNFSGTTFYSGNSSNADHNCDTAVKNGHYYYTSNGPATSLGASTNDGALYTQSHSDTWASQIAQDYRNGNLFTRGKNNGTWQSWKAVSYSDHTHSYLPLSGGTISGQITFTKTDNNAIKIGTVRGTAVGGQTGEYVHIYERLHVGSPSGWGSRGAPTYGLSTYGGCWLATDQGNVGIGTTSPSSKLTISGVGGDQSPPMLITGSNSNPASWSYGLTILNTALPASRNMFICMGKAYSTRNSAGPHYYHAGDGSTSNYIGFEIWGVGTPFRTYFDGTSTSSGQISAPSFKSTSDINKKENISEYNVDLSSLKSYKYNFKDDETKEVHIGLIAQDVEAICPEGAVTESKEGVKELDYNAITALLVSEVNRLSKKVRDLEAKIDELS